MTDEIKKEWFEILIWDKPLDKPYLDIGEELSKILNGCQAENCINISEDGWGFKTFIIYGIKENY